VTLTPSSRPTSIKSNRSALAPPPQRTDESTPLLAHVDHDEESELPHTASSDTRPVRQGPSKWLASRWPSIAALVLLCMFVILIMLLGFIFPDKVREYATQAMTFEPTSLSIDGFTDKGVKARVQGVFKLDSSRVKDQSTKNIGRFGTWIAKEVQTGETKAEVYLPEYSNALLGSATIPGIKVNVRDGQQTHVDFVADIEPGSFDTFGKIARDWMDGKLDQLKVLGKAAVAIQSGLISLPEQVVIHELIFKSMSNPL